MHTIPPDMKEKEKIFGGIFTLEQFGWIAGGTVIGLLISLLFYKVISFFGFIFLLLGVMGGFFMAFYKIREMSVTTFLRRKWKFKRKVKRYTNRRARVNFTFSPRDIGNDSSSRDQRW